MLDTCVRATVLLAAALVSAAVLRRSSAAVRHLLWASTMAGLLALPLFGVLVPSITVTVPAVISRGLGTVIAASLPVPRTVRAPAAAALGGARSGDTRDVEEARGSMGPGGADELGGADEAGGMVETRGVRGDASAVAVVIWALGAVVILGRLALGFARVRVIVRRTAVVSRPEWTRLLVRVSERLALRRRVALRMGAAGAVPVTCGILHPIVILPAEAESWDDERRTLVLTHELAHVRRFDVLTHVIGQLAVAAFWFHPLAWLAAARMRLESERACDDLVLTAGGGVRPSRYAGDLLAFAQAVRGPGAPAVAALAMARRTEIEGRLLAILDGAVRRGPIGRRRIAAALSVAAAAVVVLATVRPVAASPRAASAGRGDMPEPAVVTLAPVRAVAASGRHVPLEVALANEASVAATLPSDVGKRNALLRIVPRYCGHDTLRTAFFSATSTITSDSERRRVLLGLFGRGGRDVATVAEVLRAAGGMTSDADKAAVLRTVAGFDRLADRTVRREFVAAVSTIHSSADRARVLRAVGSNTIQE